MWDENEIRKIIPQRVEKVLGFVPSIVYYEDDCVRAHDLLRYNSGIMASANHFTLEHPEYRFYIVEQFEKNGVYFSNMQAFFGSCQNLDEIVSCKPPQTMLDCVEGNDEILALHLVETQDELFLQDIVLQNPAGTSTHRLPGQKLPGIGNSVFGEVMRNLGTYALSNGYPRIALYAATVDHIPVFESVGYSLDTRFPELIMLAKMTGCQVPMVKEL